jgi:hypothetical protein
MSERPEGISVLEPPITLHRNPHRIRSRQDADLCYLAYHSHNMYGICTDKCSSIKAIMRRSLIDQASVAI